MIEMLHLQLVARMVSSLGGSLRYWNSANHYWSGGNVGYEGALCDKLSLDIFAEQAAVNGYETVLRKIKNMGSPELAPVSSVIERILEDENHHLALFKEAYTEYSGRF
jgi:Mn-containing catalase